MICLISNSYANARKFAASQHLESNEWFFASSAIELYKRSNFHVIAVIDGLESMPNSILNELLTLAWKRGKIGRL